MRIGCAALYPITRYGFPYSLDDYLKAVGEMRAAGFDACELEINVDVDLTEYVERVDEVKRTLTENGMTLSAVIGVVQQGFSTDRAVADESLRRYDRLCQFVHDVRCDTVCVCAYMPKEIEGVPGTEMYRGSPPLQVRVPQGFNWDAFWENAVARFGQMAQTAARRDQQLIIENRVGDFVNTSDGVLKLIEDAGEPNAGCLLDVAHTHATKEHLALVIPKLKRRLRYVHLADNDGSASRHLPAGQGNVDFPGVFHSLKEIGYDGYVNVDYGGVPADRIWEEANRGREYFKRCLDEMGA
ncbi:MAG: sugar phosphate isomerase/epimerase [Chloroflexi bacterium]|nr:sugar phosphate isomerase/epimerase [Chloroflexota bacterium]